jgi:ABC-2 type transport system permease protein
MVAFFAMIRKQLAESRWFLAFSAAALFGLGWLFVFVTLRIENQMKENEAGGMPRMAMMRSMGGSAMDFSSTAIEVMLWNHPFILLTVAIWAIARGSTAPAGEVEKGTADLTLSRPVSRLSYQGSQVVVAIIGLFVLTAALVAGNRVGNHYNVVQDPPILLAVLRPAVNLAVLGLAIYGYTFLLSSLDSVRWRPNLFGSALTLASFIAMVVANLPSMEQWKWLEKLSLFKAYQPVELAVKGETLAFNVSVLGGIALAGIVFAFLAFQWRDIPSSS